MAVAQKSAQDFENKGDEEKRMVLVEPRRVLGGTKVDDRVSEMRGP